MGTNTYSQALRQTHSIVFLSDNLRNTLREVIRENGLSPERLMQDWDTIERGIKTWLSSRHLNNIIVEFFKPGASVASARWEFPVGYTGSGVDDDMWLDKAYLRQLIAKAARPSSIAPTGFSSAPIPAQPRYPGSRTTVHFSRRDNSRRARPAPSLRPAT